MAIINVDYVYSIRQWLRDHIGLMNITSSYSKHSKHNNDKEYRKQIKELSDNLYIRASVRSLDGHYNLLTMSMFNRSAELTHEEILDIRREQEEVSRRALRLSVWKSIPVEKPTVWQKILRLLP